MTRLQRRRFLSHSIAAGTALALPSIGIRAQSRPVLKAGDQKGGLRALLEAAGALQGLGYDIQWSEFPDRRTAGRSAQRRSRRPRPHRRCAADLRAGGRHTRESDRREPFRRLRHGGAGAARFAAQDRGRSQGQERGDQPRLHRPLRHAEGDHAGRDSSPDDINLRFLAPADAKLALTQGSVDAWATWEPYTALAETSHHARVLASGRGLLPGLSYLAATDAAIAAKRPVLQDFLLRVVRAQDWSNRNVDTYSATLARIIGIPPEAARLQFERRQQKWVPIDAKVIADQQATADFYRQVGLIKQPLDVESHLRHGLRRGGLIGPIS